MKVYTVVTARGGSPEVVSADVLKETPQFYMIGRNYREAFGWSMRLIKDRYDLTAEDALRRYIVRRERDADYSQKAANKALSEVNAAGMLLYSLLESAKSADAGATPSAVGAPESA